MKGVTSKMQDHKEEYSGEETGFQQAQDLQPTEPWKFHIHLPHTEDIRLDEKATLRNKVQDILSGRSRFVIRKTTGSSGDGKQSAKACSKSGSSGNERLKHDDQKKTPDSDKHPEPVTEVKKALEAD